MHGWAEEYAGTAHYSWNFCNVSKSWLHSPCVVPYTSGLQNFFSLTQPDVLDKREWESEEQLQAHTPTVYLIGSRMNAAMYANMLTSTTKVKQPDGKYILLGQQYPSA